MDHSPSGETVDKKPLLASDGTILPTSGTTESSNFKKTTSSSNLIGNIEENNQKPGTLTVEQLTDIEILPLIYDIVACVEKDPLDIPAKQRESTECSQKILELQKRFESARAQIKQLPGIDFNKAEQLQQFEQLKKQLTKKQNLLLKYKDIQF